MTALLSHSTNLARLGNAGDTVQFGADADQCAAIAEWSGVTSIGRFDTRVDLRKTGLDRFALDYVLTADVVQACVVTLEPVPARIDHKFTRELHFAGAIRRKLPVAVESEVVLDADPDEGPEEIESLHYDLAVPVLEEFILALEPYPRCPGVEFQTPDDGMPPRESPFAALKSLKPEL
jgi:uncharacterized metal-binding protein YceD (DUF177 family)